MLRCTIVLIPHGDETRAEVLSTMTIINDGTGSHEIGNYLVSLDEGGLTKQGSVLGHPRLQHGPAFLVAKAIEACLKGDK